MSPEQSVTSALAEYVTPLSSTDPEDERGALSTLVPWFENASVVGLGEATHGTRECFALKERIVRFLVEECGFRTVALETDFAKTRAIGEYVHDGEGDPRDALAAVTLWVWKSGGILSLLEWLRAFNAGRPPDDRVRFHGISLSSPGEPASALQASLQVVDPDYAAEQAETLDRIATTGVPTDETDDTEQFLETGLAVADRIRARLQDSRERYVEASSVREYRVARRLCRHLEQNCEWNRQRLSTPGQFDPEAFEQRDRHMAENVGWAHDHDPGEGVVVWAHNTHVKRGSFDMDHEWAQGSTMGEFLARNFGSGYRPVGMDLARGQFRAVPDSDDSGGEPRTFSLTPPADDSLSAHLDRHDSSPLFLDVAAASDDDRLGAWFDRERRVRGVSALVDPDRATRVHDIETDLAEAFDGLCFVDETNPSEPIENA